MVYSGKGARRRQCQLPGWAPKTLSLINCMDAHLFVMGFCTHRMRMNGCVSYLFHCMYAMGYSTITFVVLQQIAECDHRTQFFHSNDIIYTHKSNANSRFHSLVTFIALAPLHAWWCCQWWWLCHRWDFYRTWETSILSNCCRFIPMQCKQTNKQTNNIAFYFIYI